MTLLADLLSTVFERRYRRESQEAAKDGRPLVEMAAELVGSAGETSGIALAEEIMARFKLLDDTEKLDFFRDIARTMNIDPERARTALDAYEAFSFKSKGLVRTDYKYSKTEFDDYFDEDGNLKENVNLEDVQD